MQATSPWGGAVNGGAPTRISECTGGGFHPRTTVPCSVVPSPALAYMGALSLNSPHSYKVGAREELRDHPQSLGCEVFPVWPHQVSLPLSSLSEVTLGIVSVSHSGFSMQAEQSNGSGHVLSFHSASLSEASLTSSVLCRVA